MRQRILLAAIGGLLLTGMAHGAQDREQGAAAAQSEAAGHERIGRFIYAFHRAGVSVEKLTDPVLARRAPPELAQRAGALAERFEQILKQRAAVPDQELHATLREAHQVGAAMRLWHDSQLR